MQLNWSDESKTISIGNFKTNKYISHSLYDWTNCVLIANGYNFEGKRYEFKRFYKEAADFLKCTPSVLYKIFNKLQYKHFVVPYMDYASKLAFNKRGIDPVMLSKIVKNKDTLDQVKSDGLMNLIPFVCKHGKNPSELKEMFGKHWKKIANNSLHKNKYLSLFGVHAGKYAEVPTTLLMQRRLIQCASINLMKHLELHYKGAWKDIEKNHAVLHTFIDTERMADILGKKVNPAWTPRRLKEEHDKLVKEVNARKYSKDAFDSVKDIKHKEVKHRGICAILLDNAFDIAEEGTCMSHCVGMYGTDVNRGNYLVYSIRDEAGNRLSTLGIIIYNDNKSPTRFMSNQHYGKCNSTVTSEDQIELVESVILKLNKE